MRPGRMEEIMPGVYLDGAHTMREESAPCPCGCVAFGKRKILLFAVSSDKRVQEMAEILLREFARMC